MYMDILKLRLHFGNGIDNDSNPILHRDFGSLFGQWRKFHRNMYFKKLYKLVINRYPGVKIFST